MRDNIPLENDIENLYRHTTQDWTDQELEELDEIAQEIRHLFRKVERRLSEVSDAHTT